MRFTISSKLLILVMVLALALPGVVWAQSTTTGVLSGTVSDPSGAVLPGITVNLKNLEKGFTSKATTNSQGAYQFPLLEPGTYAISISAPSFKTWTETTTVSVESVTTANAKLEVGASGTTVEVSGEAPLLQTESAEISTTFNAREISEVPNPGQDLTFVAQTAAGSVMNTGMGYGNFSSFGLSASSNLFTLNGMYDNDPFLNVNNSGATNLLLGNNEVQEATVVTNGYSGQYGGFIGANVNYITKSGSNNWHGNANYWWNGRVMNGNDYFHTDYTNPSLYLPRAFDNANQYAASFGGPIWKNKAFFFWNYEGLRVLLPVSYTGLLAPTNPSTPGLAADAGGSPVVEDFETATTNNLTATGYSQSVPFYTQAYNVWNGAKNNTGAILGNPSAPDTSGCQGNIFTDPVTGAIFGAGFLPCTTTFSNSVGNFTHEYLTSGRFDFNLTNNDKLFARLQEDIGWQATATDPLNAVFNSTSYQPEYQAQVSWNRALGLKAANNLLISDQYYRAIFGPSNLPAALAKFPTTMLLSDSSLTTVGGIDYAWPQGRNVTGYQLVEDFSYILNSKHTAKLGLYFHRNLISDHDMGIFSSGLDIPIALAGFYSGTPALMFNQSFPSSLDEPVKLYQLGWYVQDEWKPRSDLKLTVALRMDHNKTPICGTNCFARLAGPVDTILTQGASTPYNQAIDSNLGQSVPSFSDVVFQPRFGFAYSPSMLKNTVFRGGIGIFMDTFQGSIADSLIENTPLDNSFGGFVGNVAGYPTASGQPCSTSGQIANGGNIFATACASNAALVSGFNSSGTLASISAAVPVFTPPSVTTVGNIKAPTTTEWNFEVQHGFGNNTSISVNYVGSHGIHETMGFNGVNGYCPPSVCPNGWLQLPTAQQAGGLGLFVGGWDGRFASVNDIRTAAVSSYNGLSVSVQHRFAHGLQLQGNYLWGHAIDEVSNGGLNPFIESTEAGYTVQSLLNPVNDSNLRQFNYGNADYDARHSFNANYVYEIPKGPTPALKGWQLSGTFFFRTGFPYTVINSSAQDALAALGYAGPVYAEYTGSGHPSCSGPSGSLDVGITPCIPTSSFPGFSGNSPTCPASYASVDATCQLYSGIVNQRRNQFVGPKYFDTDMTVMKYTQLPHWESAKVGLGVQFFNLFNHPNFQQPINDINNSFFGQVQGTVNPPTSILGSFLGGDASPRLIQLTAKFNF